MHAHTDTRSCHPDDIRIRIPSDDAQPSPVQRQHRSPSLMKAVSPMKAVAAHPVAQADAQLRPLRERFSDELMTYALLLSQRPSAAILSCRENKTYHTLQKGVSESHSYEVRYAGSEPQQGMVISLLSERIFCSSSVARPALERHTPHNGSPWNFMVLESRTTAGPNTSA